MVKSGKLGKDYMEVPKKSLFISKAKYVDKM